MEAEGGRVTAPAPGEPRPLRVLLDARKLGDGGIGVYIETVVLSLVSNSNIEMTLLSTAERLATFEWARAVKLLPDDTPRYSLQEYFALPRRINWALFDVFHVPHYTLPYRVPVPAVVTIHDLIHISHPRRLFEPLIARMLIRSAVRRATTVITPSQATAHELAALMGTDSAHARKIQCIPNALHPDFARCGEPMSSSFALPARYLLCIASQDRPHKGLVELLAAWSRIAPSHPALSLVIAGQGIRELGELPERVVSRGFVSRSELSELYRSASGVVIPSRAEGFGFVLLEAHAHGVPCLVRPVPALLELVGEGDIVCGDVSIDALVSGLRSFVDAISEGERSVQLSSRHLLPTFGREMARIYQEAAE